MSLDPSSYVVTSGTILDKIRYKNAYFLIKYEIKLFNQMYVYLNLYFRDLLVTNSLMLPEILSWECITLQDQFSFVCVQGMNFSMLLSISWTLQADRSICSTLVSFTIFDLKEHDYFLIHKLKYMNWMYMNHLIIFQWLWSVFPLQ